MKALAFVSFQVKGIFNISLATVYLGQEAVNWDQGHGVKGQGFNHSYLKDICSA